MNWLWRIYQAAIVGAVFWSDYRYNWNYSGPKHMVPIFAILAAFIATTLPIAVLDLFRRGKSLLLSGGNRVDDRGLPRR